MRTNGTISIKTQTGGGYDANHDAIPVTVTWSTPVACLILTNTHNNKGSYKDGTFTIAKYEIHVDGTEFTGQRVKLVNDRGSELGEFEIQDVQFLDYVDRVKILV